MVTVTYAGVVWNTTRKDRPRIWHVFLLSLGFVFVMARLVHDIYDSMGDPFSWKPAVSLVGLTLINVGLVVMLVSLKYARAKAGFLNETIETAT
jgi:hypothetical protein